MMRQYELVERVLAYDAKADEALLNRAYVYAMKAHSNQKRASGDPYFSHPLEVAAILTGLKLDDATIATALLHDVIEDTDATRAEIDQMFGSEIGALVDGLTKIKKLDLVSKRAEQAENFRKLLIAISSDIRVLLVKLADRLHNMRTLEHMKSESRQPHQSEETLDIYAPLAGRMGMQQLRDELEDLSFKLVEPRCLLARLEKSCGPPSSARNRGLVDEISTALDARLGDAGMTQRPTSPDQGRDIRPRERGRIRSGARCTTKHISLEQLSDIYAFRVMAEQPVEDCYRALGVMAHTTWSAVPGRFKDYISTPKQNSYQVDPFDDRRAASPARRTADQNPEDARHRRIRRRGAFPLQGRNLYGATNGSKSAKAAKQRRGQRSRKRGWALHSGCASLVEQPCSTAPTPRKNSWSTPSSSCFTTRCSASRPRAA